MGERGSAPAEFVLVSALLAALVLASIQVLLVGYVKQSLSSAASEGARWAALVDVEPEEAVLLTRELIAASLSPEHAKNIAVSRSMERGYPTAQVSVSTPFPALGLWSVGGTLTISAHAPLEYAR